MPARRQKPPQPATENKPTAESTSDLLGSIESLTFLLSEGDRLVENGPVFVRPWLETAWEDQWSGQGTDVGVNNANKTNNVNRIDNQNQPPPTSTSPSAVYRSMSDTIAKICMPLRYSRASSRQTNPSPSMRELLNGPGWRLLSITYRPCPDCPDTIASLEESDSQKLKRPGERHYETVPVCSESLMTTELRGRPPFKR